MGREVVLDRAHLVAMLQDPQFFVHAAEFLFLRQSVLDADAAATQMTPTGCCDVWRLYRPVADAFVLHIAELSKSGDHALKKIKAYLSWKKRYDVSRVEIYYRGSRGGKIQKLKF